MNFNFRNWVDSFFRGIWQSITIALAMLFFVLFLCSMWVYANNVDLVARIKTAVFWLSLLWLMRTAIVLWIVWRRR